VLESHLSIRVKEVRRERMHDGAFLSHAAADKPTVERLANKLREASRPLEGKSTQKRPARRQRSQGA